jgi:hypothetical protein
MRREGLAGFTRAGRLRQSSVFQFDGGFTQANEASQVATSRLLPLSRSAHIHLVRRQLRWRCLRRKKSLPGQLLFAFVTSPTPIFLTPPAAPRRDRRDSRWNVPSWRPQRPHGERGLSEERTDWQVDRWVSRHAGCCLCRAWPAPHDRLVGGRLVVLCKRCNTRPDSDVRLHEIISQDWRREHTIEPNVRPS